MYQLGRDYVSGERRALLLADQLMRHSDISRITMLHVRLSRGQISIVGEACAWLLSQPWTSAVTILYYRHTLPC